MRRLLLIAATWLAVVALGTSPALAISFNFEEIKSTFSAVVDSTSAQGIVLLRSDGNQDGSMADGNWYLRRLAAGMPYRLTINARSCADTPTPGSRRVVGFKLTADADGVLWGIVRHEMTHGLGAHPSFSVWEGWSGSQRRACARGFHIHVNPFQVVATKQVCSFQTVGFVGDAKGMYEGRCTAGGGKDALYIEVPLAQHQYRVTVNTHRCGVNKPNADRVRQYRATSDQYSEIFKAEVSIESIELAHEGFSVSIYDGWTGKDRLACSRGYWFDGTNGIPS